jgi:hypothetical protein
MKNVKILVVEDITWIDVDDHSDVWFELHWKMVKAVEKLKEKRVWCVLMDC